VPSTQSLTELPPPSELIGISRSIAMMDAILCEDWEMRYFSFNSFWASAGEMMASMRNGQGDDYFIWFTPAVTAIKGFHHEAYMSPYRHNRIYPGVLPPLPPAFHDFVNEASFSMRDVTFCIWRESGDLSWKIGDIDWPSAELGSFCDGTEEGSIYDPDGSRDLLFAFDGKPETYWLWANDYYELADNDIELLLEDVAHVYAQRTLTNEMLERLSARSLFGLKDEIKEIGYGLGADFPR